MGAGLTCAVSGCGGIIGKSGGDAYAAVKSKPLDGIERADIHITGIEVTPLSYVHNGDWLWRCGGLVVWKSDAALCRIYTDKGITGIAEGSPYAGPDRIKAYTDTQITPFLIGKNPFDCGIFSAGGIRDNQLSFAAWAGIDNACWDVIGKAVGQPVYQLLADTPEPSNRVRLYASGGVCHAWYEDGEAELIEEALRYKEEGYDTFKFRNGTNWKYSGMTLEKYIRILENLRTAVGPEYRLCIEKFPWTFEEIVGELCPALEELKFHWYEEPVGPDGADAVEQHLAIGEAMPSVMVSGGETQYQANGCHAFLRTGAWDIVQTDCNLTGISENWRIARLADLYGRLFDPHNWVGGLTTIANAHLAAAMPNSHQCELNQTYNPLKWDIFKEPYPIERGVLVLPDKPGFGVELIDDIERRFPFTPGHYYKRNPVYEGLDVPIWWG